MCSLALYQSLNQLFKIFDSMMASHIGASSVSAVAYLSQINLMLSSLGGGLAVGASIKISEAYGAGDFLLVKRRVSSFSPSAAFWAAAFSFCSFPLLPSFCALPGRLRNLLQKAPSISFWISSHCAELFQQRLHRH